MDRNDWRMRAHRTHGQGQLCSRAMRRDTIHGWLVAAAGAAILIAAGCGGGDPAAPASGEIVISPANPSVTLAETIRLSAAMTDGGSDGRSFHWSSSDESIATVDASGLVTPRRVGTVRIAASAAGRSGVTSVEVARERVARLELDPADVTLSVGDTVTLEVTAFSAGGTPLDGRAFTLVSDAPTVVATIEGGRLVGLSPGQARMTVTSEGVSATATAAVSPARVAALEVTPASLTLGVGASAGLRVLVRDRSGALLDPSLAGFASTDDRVATVSADGVVTAVATGSSRILITAGDASATVEVVVTPQAVARVTISPTTATLTVGSSTRLAVTVADASGHELTGRRVEWSSTDPSVATVSDSGTVRAIAPGVAIITASSEGISATAGVTVTRARVATISLTPASDTLEIGETLTLMAGLRDAAGRGVTGVTVSWTGSADEVATVSASGVVTALSPGTARVTATADGASATATIVVRTPEAEPPPAEPPPAEPPPAEPPPAEPPPAEPPPAEPPPAEPPPAEPPPAEPPPPVEPPDPGPPSSVELVSGDTQRGSRNAWLADPVVVRVVDAKGVPVAGVLVLWWAGQGGSVAPDALLTGSDGTVSARWRLGPAQGEQRATATVIGLSSVTFHATAVRR